MAELKELFLAGKKLKEEKKYEEAVEKLKQCLELDEKFALALHAIIQCHTELGQHDQAIEYGKKLIEIEPNDNFSYIALSRAYQRGGYIPEAEHMMAMGHQVAARAR